jgi:hypothetical protein
MSASAKPASMSATEPATMSTTEPATMSTTAAARKRISGQSGGESGSRREDDHRLSIAHTPSDAIPVHSIKQSAPTTRTTQPNS